MGGGGGGSGGPGEGGEPGAGLSGRSARGAVSRGGGGGRGLRWSELKALSAWWTSSALCSGAGQDMWRGAWVIAMVFRMGS